MYDCFFERIKKVLFDENQHNCEKWNLYVQRVFMSKGCFFRKITFSMMFFGFLGDNFGGWVGFCSWVVENAFYLFGGFIQELKFFERNVLWKEIFRKLALVSGRFMEASSCPEQMFEEKFFFWKKIIGCTKRLGLWPKNFHIIRDFSCCSFVDLAFCISRRHFPWIFFKNKRLIFFSNFGEKCSAGWSKF